LGTVAAVFSVAVVSCSAYYFLLGCFFTGTDTFTLIETSRIDSVGDLLRILNEPLMAGTRFEEVAKFYRPLSTLSYSLDFWIWNLDPFGYQLTSLLLNSLTSVLVFLVFRALSDGDVSFAWLSAIVFATHPILMESVPAIDRRHDILAAVFLLLTLLFYLRVGVSETRRKAGFFVSLLCALLALLAKEISIILPFLIAAHATVFGKHTTWMRRVRSTLGCSAPYFALTSGFVVWRTLVVGGVGGYIEGEPYTFPEAIQHGVNIIHNYCADLFYPVDFLGVLDDSSSYGWTAFVIMLVSSYTLMCSIYGGCWKSPMGRSTEKRLWAFLIAWLALPLALFLGILTFAHRSMYIPAIPFSAMVAYPLIQAVRSRRRSLGSPSTQLQPVGSVLRIRGRARIAMAVASSGLCLSLIAYSPLVRGSPDWVDSSRISALFLNKLANAINTLPVDCCLNLHNLPDRILGHQSQAAHSKEVAYLQDYSIKSWINLCNPNNFVHVIIHSRSWPDEFYGYLGLRFRVLGQKHVRVYVSVAPGQRHARR
jgi:hypothetical protein